MANTNTTVYHLGNQRFAGQTPDFQQVMVDAGSDPKTGMNPMELVLNALGACAALDIVEMIKKRRLELLNYRIELSGERVDGAPSPFTHIHAVHTFNVPGLDEKTAKRFVDLGMNKYCSVASSLKAELSFEVRLEHPQA